MAKQRAGLRPAGRRSWLLRGVLLTAAVCALTALLAGRRTPSPQQALLSHVGGAVGAALGETAEVPAAEMGLLSVSHAADGWYVDVLAMPGETGGVCVWTARVLLRPDGGTEPVSAEKLYVWPRAADA